MVIASTFLLLPLQENMQPAYLKSRTGSEIIFEKMWSACFTAINIKLWIRRVSKIPYNALYKTFNLHELPSSGHTKKVHWYAAESKKQNERHQLMWFGKPANQQNAIPR